jgi:hypothetical protein
MQCNSSSPAYFDLDTNTSRARPHTLTDFDGEFSALETLVYEPQANDKLVSFETPDRTTIYEIPDFFEDVDRKSASQPDLMDNQVEYVL